MALKTVSKEKSSTKAAKPRAVRAPKVVKTTKVAKSPTPQRAEFSEILFDAVPCTFLAPTPPYIWIDYPVEHEHLGASEYVIRLGVGGEQQVEIAFNGGSWQPCRYASGFWWYDWANIAPGTHTLVARLMTPEGTWYRTPVRTCHFPA